VANYLQERVGNSAYKLRSMPEKGTYVISTQIARFS